MTWQLKYPAPNNGLFLEQIPATQDDAQRVVLAASDAGRILERNQIVRLLERLNIPLETIQAVTNGDHYA